jgi:A/G-specific adenine glycosylase
MLQQTQAGRVVDPYLRFVSRFPTPAACAEAGAADVLRAWAGLGYNRRAVRLHRAAVAMVHQHGGDVPADLGALRALPGVGEYTARAVLVFAFEVPIGLVDTNVARVLARAVAGRQLDRVESQRLADRLVHPQEPWRYTQTMFDIGARVCTARRPACGDCPLRRRCRWARSGRPVPDPAGGTRRQAAFAGSDRQGRGRLVDALRHAPVPVGQIPAAAGWPDDRDRARRAADALVSEGIARWSGVRESLHLA